MAIPAEAQGITAAILCAVFSTANLMISKILQAWDWPYFFLAGLSALCITLGLAITMACQKTYKLQRREVKWVILRGFFGCGNNVLSVCAVLAGAEVGSVGALGCVNTVVAALLGRLVLGEALGKLHILAVLFSLTGAVLICDPAQAISSMGSSLLGNFLALLGGVSLGCMFISSRKSGSASSMMLTTSAMLQRCIICWSLHFIPAVPDGRFELLGKSLPQSFLFFCCLAAAIFLTNILSSVASKKCPAALSSTMMNGSCMAFGYVMDILIFHKVPTKLTVIGAAMMLLAVMTMALTRLPRKSARTETHLPTKEDTATPSSAASAGSRATSLASFVASEFAERQEMIPSELPGPSVSGPRQRLPSTLPASVFGVQA